MGFLDRAEAQYLRGVAEETGEHLAKQALQDVVVEQALRKKILPRVASAFAAPVGLAFTAEDVYSGYKNAPKYYKKPNNWEKAASAYGGLAHGMSLGAVPEETVAHFIAPPVDRTLKPPTEQQMKQSAFMNNILTRYK